MDSEDPFRIKPRKKFNKTILDTIRLNLSSQTKESPKMANFQFSKESPLQSFSKVEKFQSNSRQSFSNSPEFVPDSSNSIETEGFNIQRKQ